MQTREISVNEIYPYENNPRINDNAVDAVARSIQEFGFQQPLVLDKDHVIIVGHTRYKAALQLGLETVPCVIADNLSEEQVRAYRLADNKVGELAQWDQALLNIELGEIEMDMTDFGFLELEVNLDVSDEDFISDTEITKSKTKMIRCPHCGEEFEA